MKKIKLKKNWKCKIGIHDYEIIKIISVSQLKENVLCEAIGTRPVRIFDESCDRRVHQVCLRCGKEVNTIAEETTLIYKNDDRMIKAREIIKRKNV